MVDDPRAAARGPRRRRTFGRGGAVLGSAGEGRSLQRAALTVPWGPSPDGLVHLVLSTRSDRPGLYRTGARLNTSGLLTPSKKINRPSRILTRSTNSLQRPLRDARISARNFGACRARFAHFTLRKVSTQGPCTARS